jgi:GTPase SAR1 family protein
MRRKSIAVRCSLRPLAYQGAHCVLLCFALDNPKSLKNLREYWEAEVHGALGVRC